LVVAQPQKPGNVGFFLAIDKNVFLKAFFLREKEQKKVVFFIDTP
jgi:hypothetical protein